jgi:hypothetical protein
MSIKRVNNKFLDDTSEITSENMSDNKKSGN